MQYLLMYRNECGEERRAHGSKLLEGKFEFPDFDNTDDAMFAAFDAWRTVIEERAQKEWDKNHEPGEVTIFLEEDYAYKFKHMSLAELENYARYCL